MDVITPLRCPSIEIVEVRSAIDAAEARALLLDHVEWITLAAGFDPLRAQPALAEELADLERHLANPSVTLFLARQHQRPVGTVGIVRHPDRSAELKRMYVRPVARGTGVADALLTAALQRAAAMGCHRIWLETLAPTMARALAVYRRHGFSEVSDRAPTLRDVDGVVVMERPIEASGSDTC